MYVDEEDQQSEAVKEKAKRKIKKYDLMLADRSQFEEHWQECMDYIIPRKSEITTVKTPGDKRGQDLFDTTAVMANQLLAGALHGMLTNPAIRFFEFLTEGAELNENEEVKEYLHEVGEIIFLIMNNSNYQTEQHETYLDRIAIGTSCMFIGEHDQRVVHFSARSMKEIVVEENNLGLIDTVSRCYKWTPRQIIQEWGADKVPKFILRADESGNNDKLEIIHAVEPASNEYKAAKKHAFESCYILKDMNYILHEGGFFEFPYAVPRWTKITAEKYGRGPGMEMLPDIKLVNKMMETTLRGAQKTVDPPTAVEDTGVMGRVRLTPGGVVLIRPGSNPPKPIITDARVDFGYQAVEDVRRRIRAGFYVDQLQLAQQGPQMTATEVNARTEQQLRLMGPVLGRQHFEDLRPTAERVFGIAMRRGLLPPVPEVLQGKKIDVRYSSLIARAQRMTEGQNVSRALTVVTPLAQAKPEVLDNLNEDEAFKEIFDIYGVSPSMMRKEDEVEKIRKDRAEAQQAAIKQQQEAHQAEVASKVMPGTAQMQQAGMQ